MQRPQNSMSRRRFLAGAGGFAASTALPTVLFARTGGAARLVVWFKTLLSKKWK